MCDVWQVYRIPFYCNDSVGCELILDFPDQPQAAAFQGTPNTVLARTDKRLRVGFGPVRGRWGLMKWLNELGTRLSTVPDGTRLEMVLADDSADGVLRKELYSAFSDGSSLTTTTPSGPNRDEPTGRSIASTSRTPHSWCCGPGMTEPPSNTCAPARSGSRSPPQELQEWQKRWMRSSSAQASMPEGRRLERLRGSVLMRARLH